MIEKADIRRRLGVDDLPGENELSGYPRTDDGLETLGSFTVRDVMLTMEPPPSRSGSAAALTNRTTLITRRSKASYQS